MDDEEFEICIEFPVGAPFKEKKKNEFLQTLIDHLKEFGAKSSDIKQSYYMDRKSAKALQTFVVNITTIFSRSSISKFSVDMINQMKDANGTIAIKQKNGKELVLKNNMTEDEIMRFFNNGK